ncbi:neurotrypsin [Elysia marginata]|uniref:Neurotrypsin n=1 Tax=Elysia marginata TaxID=1093978 RepID=A0AAV4F5S2_9GAST|nr:neurotrypsin [Elysia marginata]
MSPDTTAFPRQFSRVQWKASADEDDKRMLGVITSRNGPEWQCTNWSGQPQTEMHGGRKLLLLPSDPPDDPTGKLEVDSRGLKINSQLLHREVDTLKSLTSTLSDELESSMKEVNTNLDQQDQFIRTLVQDTVLKMRQDSKQDVLDTLNEVMASRDAVEKPPTNCSVDFAPVTEHVDQRLTRLKRDVYTGVSNLLKGQTSVTTDKCDEILKRYQTETCAQREAAQSKPAADEIKNSRVGFFSSHATLTASKRAKFNLKKAKQSTTADVPPRGLGIFIRETPKRPTVRSEQPAPKPTQSKTPISSDLTLQNENDEKIMEALANMTTSVQQAVSYFRNTGYILEVILSNTDMILNGQKPAEQKPIPMPFQERKQFRFSRQPFFDDRGGVEAISMFPGARETNRPLDGLPGPKQTDNGCKDANQIVRNIADLVKNGSQLLELLTDLAEMSSMSLTKATDKLQTQVSSMEGIQSTLDAALSALGELDSGSGAKNELLKISNTTDKISKLVEVIATHSGWLPLIFHNVKHQDAVGNRTLHLVSQNHGMLRRLAHSARHQQVTAVKGNVAGARSPGGSRQILSLDEESLETIYSTSLQLHRIMPALTKLLAEPDPLFTLVDGGRPDQGRIEIYHKGRWGALCQRDISHEEADMICRHLGFPGGISAGAGRFGAGAGVSWNINASCLATAQCTSVSHDTTSAPCSHDLDAGLICGNDGWAGRSARVACQQMGYSDGRQTEIEEWPSGSNSTWLTRVSCRGDESRLDICRSGGWKKTCKDLKPAGVRCV